MATNREIEPQGIEGPRRDFPRVSPEFQGKPIDRLRPGSDLHADVLSRLTERIEDSERAMSQFYARWAVQERKVQAYLDLESWEQVLKEQNEAGEAPKVVTIQVPYSFAVIATIVTFLLHTFTGRKPLFQVGTWKDETGNAARRMEVVLQYNADHTRLIKFLWQFFQDTQLYGLGVLRSDWERKEGLRTVRDQQTIVTLFASMFPGEPVTRREKRVIYEGNKISSHDPYMFYPDPRVPMTEVNRRGEYVFFRSFEGAHTLKQMEAAGDVSWVDYIGEKQPRNYTSVGVETSSVRSLMAGGDSQPGSDYSYGGYRQKAFKQIDQGTVWIIPREWGLASGEEPELWQFSIGNKTQIIQAEPYGADHGMHPCCVSEPYGLGYGFGNLGIADYLGPLQDTMGWLINSHMDNVRRVLNDVLIVDPSMIEMQDLKKGEPGLLVRLKQSAFGQDVRSAIQQLSVIDVTRGHMEDLETFLRIGQLLSAVSENVMGAQDQGGRKTATEVRTAGEAAASRLAAQSRIISAQAIVDLAEQMAVNIQQYLSDDFYVQIVGKEGIREPLRVTPDQLAGDFFYPVHDGTLPLDRVALMDVWRELFQVALQDPVLRQSYDIPRFFEFIGELGGAKNIEGMRLQPEDPEFLAQRAAEGNAIPLNGGQAGPPRIDQGLGRPANRAEGALQ